MAETFEQQPETGGNYEPLGAAELLDHDARSLRLRAGSTIVEVAALSEDIFRVGAFPDGDTPRYDSEAIAREDWGSVETSMERPDGEITLSTSGATVHVALDPLRISFTDASSRTFAADDELGMGFVRRPGADVFTQPLGSAPRLYKRREEGERYFGCGERTSGLEKTGSYQIFWNVDPPLGHTASFNNLYASIPFTLSLANGRSYGLLFDNPGRVEFDLALEDEGRAYYGAEGREVARNFREREIPCDVIYLDIHYMDGYRVFTWNDERFPDPEGLISDLGEQGFRVVTIVDPGVKVDENYDVYAEGRERDLFCKKRDGEEYHNAVWPGVCAFPDFTNPETREWWGDNHRALLDRGVAGIWCDMNEPSHFIPRNSTMPGHVVHPGGPGGEPRLHAQVHNAYGSLMARAAREGLLKLRPGERPFVITRAGYAGLQRHALQWTGDNSSWWEHLWMSMPQLQNLGLSGVAWTGVDVGGFWGDSNGELLARWTEFGAFQPFCRNHTAIGTRRQEPWAFGEPYESVCREMLKLRQRLVPYLYTVFEECHRRGSPILRPLLFEYPEDETTYTTDDEFLVGEALLVAPITRPGTEHRHVYLPRGCWFHYWTGERFDGPAHVLVHAPLGEPPLYVRANTAVPMGPEMAHTGEKATNPLTLLLYPTEGADESTLYEDAGDGFGYEEGEYARRAVFCEGSAESVTVRLGEREGTFVPGREELRLELRGFGSAPESVVVNGESARSRYDEESGTMVVSLRETEGALTVEVAR